MADAISGKTPRNAASCGRGAPPKPPSRLQRRAPSSLQISPAAPKWNVAIPLLSPLATSPTSPPRVAPCERPAAAEPSRAEPSENKQPEVFKKWQHPAAPFSYEPGPRRPSFVPV
ncbi:uncharacterized protein At4g14450, chloroplastic-like [Punica granatum]|uniref:Uncharacterized protein n=2 Tax=Punica granatum TaxID=22663 RepID=A0A218VSY0_PUNGR|nr:uncharacterized protein At4g14450, chloroplastic-like [Punica granatum]OWM63190.1 hypothetical protein CDL15_Pgr010590 [Punica granatum]PKI40053.1 hypothetical protein CRG98_039558 [Punica granatum]